MKLPFMNDVPKSTQTVSEFGGYNHNPRIPDGDWWDMENMTADHYPLLSPRKPMTVDGTLNGSDILGIVSNNGLCVVRSGTDNATFYLPNGSAVEKLVLTNTKKEMVSMGGRVVIMPDKKWVDVPKSEFGEIEAKYESSSASYWIKICSPDGEYYEPDTTGETAPADPVNGELWYDTKDGAADLKRWNEDTGSWDLILTNHVRIQTPGIGAKFEVGDSVHGKIAMNEENANKASDLGEHITENGNHYIKGQWIIVAKTSYYIVVAGTMTAPSVGSLNAYVSIERKMPEVDFLIESGNRLWGCKYGDTKDGKFVNEIYASKLGDPNNWQCYQGISTDSYTASIGADGEFTGAVNYMGRPVFFKENRMIEVYGAYPAQYQVQDIACDGILNGSAKSAAVVDNVLYYLSPNGICVYNGSLPVNISNAFGDDRFGSGIGAGLFGKYYVCLDGILFEYDTKRRLWHKQSAVEPTDIIVHNGDVIFLENDRAIRVFGKSRTITEPVHWFVESGDIGLTLPDAKYISRMDIRMSADDGTEVSLWVKYDFEDEWQYLTSITGTGLRSFEIPIRPKRCDTMRLKIVGVGDAKVYSITKSIVQGGYR